MVSEALRCRPHQLRCPTTQAPPTPADIRLWTSWTSPSHRPERWPHERRLSQPSGIASYGRETAGQQVMVGSEWRSAPPDSGRLTRHVSRTLPSDAASVRWKVEAAGGALFKRIEEEKGLDGCTPSSRRGIRTVGIPDSAITGPRQPGPARHVHCRRLRRGRRPVTRTSRQFHLAACGHAAWRPGPCHPPSRTRSDNGLQPYRGTRTPVLRGGLPHADQHARHPDPDILAAFAHRLNLKCR